MKPKFYTQYIFFNTFTVLEIIKHKGAKPELLLNSYIY
jgi:hypothetical protein